MVDISAIAGTVSALKGAMDISKAMIGLHDAQAIQSKIIELNAQILEAQSSAFLANEERSTLIEHVRQLEKEVADLKAWEAEKQRYQLAELTTGVTAYAIKEEMRGAEPSHHICASCYQEGHKSILQREIRNPGMAHVDVCQRCGSDLYVIGMRHPDHKKSTASRR